MDYKATQYKIRSVVKQYQELYPDEWKAVAEQNQARRDALKDSWAETPDMDTTHRHLLEWPETLYGMLYVKLTPEEYAAVFQEPTHKLITWIAKTYPQLRVSKAA